MIEVIDDLILEVEDKIDQMKVKEISTKVINKHVNVSLLQKEG